ncbi:MAG: DUF3772 domain-containing protein, partial [Methylobacteriaceae bacterium]|nr:DUF3772 domain-containing protein [Methylobacteriaceae bacterium]
MSRFRFLSRLVCGLALAVGLSVAAPAPAQVAAPVVAPAAPLDAKTIQDNFERFRPVLKQVEDSLAALVNPTDEDFFRLRGQVMEVSDGLQAITRDIDPRAAELKQRLAQLGPVPTEAGVTESDEVRTERTSLTSSLAKLEELQKITAALTVQAQQVLSKITEQRRSHFTRSILQRTDSALSPSLWGSFLDALPDDIRVSRNILGLWWRNLAEAYNASFIGPVPMLPPVLLLGAGFGFMLYLARRHYKRVWVDRDPAVTDPPMRRRIFAAVRLMGVDLLPMGLFLWGVLFVARAFHLNPVVFQGIFQGFIGALMLYFVARTLNDALVAPREPAWRIAVFDEIAVQRLYWFSNTLYVWIAFKIVLDAFLKAISASIPLTSVANALFAFL